MYIHEALRATTPEKSYIHRTAWDDVLFPGRMLCIDATNERACCIAYSVDGLIGPCWTPQASDLLADDWEPCPSPPLPEVSEKKDSIARKKERPFCRILLPPCWS